MRYSLNQALQSRKRSPISTFPKKMTMTEKQVKMQERLSHSPLFYFPAPIILRKSPLRGGGRSISRDEPYGVLHSSTGLTFHPRLTRSCSQKELTGEKLDRFSPPSQKAVASFFTARRHSSIHSEAEFESEKKNGRRFLGLMQMHSDGSNGSNGITGSNGDRHEVNNGAIDTQSTLSPTSISILQVDSESEVGGTNRV